MDDENETKREIKTTAGVLLERPAFAVSIPASGLPRNEFEDLVSYFAARITAQSVKPMQPGRVAAMLKVRGMLPGNGDFSDVYWLKKECDGAKNFAAMFWWHMKKK